MNIRKSSPVQSNIRTVTAPTRGPTPPPPAQIRTHFEEPSHFPSPYQAAPYQSAQPAYVDMNKPAPGRVSAAGLAQAPQNYNVPRAQHQAYAPLVAETQDQQNAPITWNAHAQQPQGTYYIAAANQNMRQPRMQAMNNGQVPGSNLAFMNMPGNLPFIHSNMTPAYNGNQGLQFVQNPSGHFMQYSQHRMQYPAPMQQQAPLSFMQPYGGPGSGAYAPYYQPPMQMPSTSRPSSVGPQGASGAVPKQARSKKMLSLTDPNTGEDITDKVFKPPTTEEVDLNAQEVQEHRNKVTIEFARKVAMLAGDKKDKEGEVSHNIQLSAQAQSAKGPILPTPSKETDAAAASIIEPAQSVSMEEHPVLNGEPDQTNDIQEDHVVDPPAPYSVPAKVELESAPQPVETVAAAADVQTPSPALAAAPVLPVVDVAAPVNIVPAKEMSPPQVVEKPPPQVVEKPPPPPPVVPEEESLPPVEAVPEVELNAVAAVQTTTVIAAVAASALGDGTAGQDGDSKPTPQASGPQPQRQDARKAKKNKKELNKKSKEGSDMDAFYDTQTSQENTEMAEPEQPAEAAPSSAIVTAATVSPTVAVEKSEVEDVAVDPQQQASPTIQVSPAPEAAVPQPQPEAPAPVEPMPAPEVKVEEPPKEEKAETPAENGVNADAELVVDKTRTKQMINGVQLNYKEGQWSPANPEGKKQYDREFLLKLQAKPESRKPPPELDMPEIMVDPRMVRVEDFQKAQALAAGRTCPDFTPGFFKSTPRAGGPGSMNKRGSQQGRRGGQGSQGGEQQRIIPSLRQEITLHKSENAYKPVIFQKDIDIDEEAKETQVNEAKETKQVLRAFTSVLNKLTPEKYSKLAQDVLQLNINTEERLSGVTDLVFEKAIAESKFATQYAYLCRDMLKLPKVPKKDKPNEMLTFRAVLLTKCQKEFESDTIVEGDLDRRRKELEKASDDKRSALVDELKEATTKARRRSMGNIRFIGELYRLKMLTENIMHDCIFKLLKIRDDDSIECLTKLLETIGKDLDHPKAKQRMDQYFAQFEKMTADMSKDFQGGAQSSQSKSKETKDKLCTRVKFSVLEIIDMRKNNWVIRKIHDQNKPSTLGEIHQKAKMEQQEQQFLNSQPRMDSSLQNRGAKGKGRGSMQGDSDGWNTVPAKPVRQQIDAAKMKITKTNVDEITLTLGGGNKFSNWGRGSQGGGSRSQEQENSGNRYNALNSLNDSDGRRGYGRSPARGDSRGGGRMGGDRDRRDRDRDFRKPASRSSMEAERERAVASTRNMLGAGAASNPSSRNSSRDNSRSRDMPPTPSKVSSGPDASQMNSEELERRLTTIAEELHSNQNIKDARESIAEISHLDWSVLVMTMLEKLVEKAGKTRKLLGQLLFDMIKERQMSLEDLTKGIAEFLKFAEDLELDIPKIWDNLAEVFAGLLQDSKVLPLHFLRAGMQPLISQGNGKAAVLVQKILKTATEYRSKDAIQAYWAASGLKFSDFGLDEKATNFELHWLKGPGRNAVHTGILNLLQNPNCTNEDVMRWIEKNFKKEEVESHQFIRELTSAICKSYFSTKEKKLDTEGLKSRVPLLRKYLDNDKERGTQALFGVQHLLCELEHPQGVVRTLFELFYDEDIISEESFFEWERRDGSPDDMVGKGVVKMNVKDFFEWLRSSGEEEDRTS